MAIVLRVDSTRWTAHIDSFHHRLGTALIPVVKGNGYGFGRATLARRALPHAVEAIAVGTVHEVADVLAAIDTAMPASDQRLRPAVIVLTPTLDPHVEALGAGVTFTVGNEAHVRHLCDAGVTAAPIVKLASSMQRYGFSAVPELDAAAYAIHPPLAGDDTDHAAEIERWLPQLDPAIPVHASHLSIDAFDRLRNAHPDRTFLLRSGTALWHGARDSLQLVADVIDVRDVQAGEFVGYRQRSVPSDGSLVMIGAGSAHGVATLEPDQRSPFHFARTRLALLEPPHMHTSMAFVPTGEPCPRIGEWVDVQRPLISTTVDRVDWLAGRSTP